MIRVARECVTLIHMVSAKMTLVPSGPWEALIHSSSGVSTLGRVQRKASQHLPQVYLSPCFCRRRLQNFLEFCIKLKRPECLPPGLRYLLCELPPHRGCCGVLGRGLGTGPGLHLGGHVVSLTPALAAGMLPVAVGRVVFLQASVPSQQCLRFLVPLLTSSPLPGLGYWTLSRRLLCTVI